MFPRTAIRFFLAFALIAVVFVGGTRARDLESVPAEALPGLENVRDFAAAWTPGGVQYAVDGGRLVVDWGEGWRPLDLPEGVIANAVLADSQDLRTVYVGAANELAVYVSRDGGRRWLRVPLASEAAGMVTDLAVDRANRLLYVATDTAGLFRLRDVGSSLIASGHLILDEPVLQVVADVQGSGAAYIRTPWRLYRAEAFGLRWVQVAGIPGPTTALALAPGAEPTLYVGTANDGVWASSDGRRWRPVHTGLVPGAGARVRVDALAVDPAQPQVLYASTSLLFGTARVRPAHVGVAMSTDGGRTWQELAPVTDAAVVELYPVTGRTGAVYAVTEFRREPVALGAAPPLRAATASVVLPGDGGLSWDVGLAWFLGGLAGVTLLALLGLDLWERRHGMGSQRPRRRST